MNQATPTKQPGTGNGNGELKSFNLKTSKVKALSTTPKPEAGYVKEWYHTEERRNNERIF
jgi:hypothetical protein